MGGGYRRLVTGTSSLGLPLPLSSSRHGFIPAIGLSYNSGSGNGIFGIGWELDVPKITRKTEKQLPQYKDETESDTFILSGAEDLVPLLEDNNGTLKPYKKTETENGIVFTVKRYRPRIEGLFAVIEKWRNDANGETHWRTVTRDNVHSYFGLTAASRLSDPQNMTKVSEWSLCRTHDDKGNVCVFEYKQEDFAGIANRIYEKNRKNNCTQIYLKKIFYGNRKPYYLGDALPAESQFLFKVIFDYGEHDASVNVPQDVDQEKNIWDCRKDAFSDYHAGFEVRTYRRCRRVLMFHCFDQPELPHNPYLTKSLELFYDDDLNLIGNGQKINGFSYLVKARQNGHLWNAAANSYSTKYLPEAEFSYQPHEWKTTVETVTEENSFHAPIGLYDRRYLWIDLYNEGISGILTEQSGNWFYKSNLGDGIFSPAVNVSAHPNFQGLAQERTSIFELEGDGIKYLVSHSKEPKGFFKLNEDGEWENFKNFEVFPNLDLTDPNLRAIDLNGDGAADLLFSENGGFRWFQGAGEKGFEVSQTIAGEIDEEKGPAVVFADLTQSIFLADLNGDGLTDIVRIRNGEICYWANLGYGRFSAKVAMDNAPVFDSPDLFNPRNLRLADIDGSGTIDVVYLGKNDFRVWLNLNGNEWTSEPQIISGFPVVNDLTDVAVLDFLGTGTACLVWSSALPKDTNQPLRYINLMNGKKPHLLIKYENNCGKEVSLEYKSSTQFYLEDKKNGRNWITKLPFPVHCISKVTAQDNIRRTVFTSSYAYAHGYYDYAEKEFRGFARVEQLDTENFSDFKLNQAKNVVEENLHQPPVRTVSWFHTGAFLRKEKILHQCRNEYFQNTEFNEYDLPAPLIADDLSADELREAWRAVKGLPLRSEVYAEDETSLSGNPYTASQTTVEIRRLQPSVNDKNAVFLVIPSESISYNYERNPADPRIVHSFVLETDELGGIKKSASVIYPRIKRPLAVAAVPDAVWDEQKKFYITYGEASFTDDVIDEAGGVYRLRVPCESKSYDISGISQPPDFFFKKDDLQTAISQTTEILFEKDFSGGKEKRLFAHGRGYFFKDDLSASLPFGKLSSLGIGHKSYQLVFTKNLVTKIYGAKVTDQMLIDAKYVHSEGDEHWWTQTGTAVFAPNPKNNFYTPIGARDVFGNESSVEYDNFTLLAKNSTDAIGNVSTVENDYRTLSAKILTDINLNRAAVETDELGMVIQSAVMGKIGDNDGDTLNDPTVRIEYDLLNWKNNGKPNFVHTFAREKHGAGNPRWQENYAYSDGGGSVVMSKNQAKPGEALRWNTATKTLDKVNANPRWIGNGRTIFNNKGNPIKQFEPYFSTTHEYESEDALVETGITPLFFYDPVGRNIRTEFPDGTFSKLEFDGWHFKAFDANDTVKDSDWYAERGSPDPALPEPVDPQKRAAWLAAKHYDTPAVIHLNSRANPFYAVTDFGGGKTTAVRAETDLVGRVSSMFDQKDRNIAESHTNLLGAVIYGKSAEKGEQWILADAMGRLVKMWEGNSREFRTTFDKLHRPLSSFIKEGANEFLFTHILYADYFFNAADARNRNLKGRVFRVYDQSGCVEVKEIDFKGNALKIERRLTKDYKAQITNWKTLDGLTTLAAINTAADPLLETEIFTAAGEVDALGRPVEIVIPGGTIYQPVFNEANFLDSLKVKLQGQGSFTTFLAAQDYDAKGQRKFVEYGNGTISEYFYNAKNYRLENLLTRLSSADANAKAVQNLNYTFDPLGNITQIRDDAQQTHFFKNSVVSPENKYEYDAAYQLLKATGREHAASGNNSPYSNSDLDFLPQLPHVNDANAVRNYAEEYSYDDCGNISEMRHLALGGSWTKRYRYEYEDDPTNNTNRLKAVNANGDPVGTFSLKYFHDAQGNMTSMPHLSAPNSLIWNFLAQLKEVNLGGGGTAFYVYGGGSSRVRKVIERPGGLIKERIYLGAVEIYRERQGNNQPHLERQTIHITDDTGEIAQVDLKTIDTNNSDTANPLNAKLIRYQYGNNLGSATLETDDAGNVISYEEYHPFGTSAYRVSKSGTDLSLKRYRFCGKERDDETGFYYVGARYYAAWLGRWTSSDPAGFVDGFNLYRYCRNNPVTLSDPSGMGPTDWGGNPSPEISSTPGEPGRIGTINFANTHYINAVEDGVRYRVRINATQAEWVGAGSNAHWQITEWTTVSSEPVPEGEEAEPDESGYEPIVTGGDSSDVPQDSIIQPQTPGEGTPGGNGAGTGTNGSGGTGPGGGSGANPSASSSSARDAASSGTSLSLAGPGAERFIWTYPFKGGLGGASQRGFILQNLYTNDFGNIMRRDNVPNFDVETASEVRQIKSTNSTSSKVIRGHVRTATNAAADAIAANQSGTMAGKNPRAVIITPTDAPAGVGTEVSQGFQRLRNPPPGALPPEHVRGLPGAVGPVGRGLTIGGTAFSAYGLYRDIREGDVPMGVADTLGTVGGGLETYAIYSAGATIGGVSAMSAGLVLGGAGIAIGSGISAYRSYQRGDTAGVVAGVVGVLAGIAIVAGVIFSAPVLLVGGLIAAVGVGLFHLGRWLFG